jgi:hypothetical protein
VQSLDAPQLRHFNITRQDGEEAKALAETKKGSRLESPTEPPSEFCQIPYRQPDRVADLKGAADSGSYDRISDEWVVRKQLPDKLGHSLKLRERIAGGNTASFASLISRHLGPLAQSLGRRPCFRETRDNFLNDRRLSAGCGS